MIGACCTRSLVGLGMRCALGVLVVSLSTMSVYAEERTADMPDSWLVLYNINVPDSITWALWYQEQRQIPDMNMIGLSASASEHLNSREDAVLQIIAPVQELLDSDIYFREHIMGIIVGYRLPGHFGTAPAGGPGGFSVAEALQDLSDEGIPAAEQMGYNLMCPQWVSAPIPPTGRVTLSQMPLKNYMVARIDAPSLELAMAMTLRAKAIEAADHYINTEKAWADYTDPQFSNGVWPWLRDTVNDPGLSEVPWQLFDADTEGTSNDAFRIDTHDINSWNNGRLASNNPGSRIFAYNFNSYGATTVRSTSADSARFVPNAIANGYAAAIGATGEPQFAAPLPRILVSCLREGWTLGESYFLCNPLNDWMWSLFGDPFLRIPNWFDVIPITPGDGDINADTRIDGIDVVLLTQIMAGQPVPQEYLVRADMSGDGQVNDDDAFLMLGPTLWGTPTPEALRGTADVNGDGRVDSRDVEPFAWLLLDPMIGIPLREKWAADMNRDGQLTMDDVGPFVERLMTISEEEASPPGPGPIPDP